MRPREKNLTDKKPRKPSAQQTIVKIVLIFGAKRSIFTVLAHIFFCFKEKRIEKKHR